MKPTEEMQLDTAVKLTKFLHSKEATKDELLQVASDVVYGQSKVYLPQRHGVVLDLLLERIGKWHDERCWQLVRDCWVELDQESQSRIYSKHDFVGLISGALKAHVVDELSTTLDRLDKDVVWVKPTTDIGYQLIGNYINLTLERNVDALAESIKPVIKPILEGSMSKKQAAAFTKNVFVPALKLSGLGKDTTLVQTIFNKQLGLGLDNTLIEQADQTPASLVELFRTICAQNVKETPQHFETITKTCPSITADCLRIALEYKIRLDQAVLQKLVEQQTLDWDTLTILLYLNSDAVFAIQERIFSQVEDTEGCVVFLCELCRSFANSREFPAFFLSWGNMVSQRPVWKHPKVVETIVEQLRSLSGTQLNSLLDSLLNGGDEHKSKKQKKTGMISSSRIAVAKSLLQNNESVVESVHTNLEAMLTDKKALRDPQLWTLKYLILCLNSGFVESAGHEIKSQVACLRLEPHDPLEMWTSMLQVIFRLREFEKVEFFDELVTKNLDFINEHGEDVGPKCLSIITNRWLVLANAHFGKQHLTLLSQLYIHHRSALMELVANPLFYEQTLFVNEMIHEMIRELDTEPDSDIIDALGEFPLQVFNQYMRKSLLDLLVPRFKESERVFKTLTRWPTFDSKLETDVALLTDLISKMPSRDMLDTLAQIVRNHVRNIHNDASSKFVTNLVKKVVALVKTPMEWSLQFATIVVEELGDASLMQDTVDYVFYGFIKHLAKVSTIETLQNFGTLLKHVDNNKARKEAVEVLKPLLEQNAATELGPEVFVLLCQVLAVSNQDAAYLTLQFIQQCETSTDPRVFAAYKLYCQSCPSQLDDLLVESRLDLQAAYLEAIRAQCAALQDSQQFLAVLSFFAETIPHLTTPRLLRSALDTMDQALRDTTLITQYALELILTIVYQIFSPRGPFFNADSVELDAVFASATTVVSSVLLFHRHRVHGRYHLVMDVFQQLVRVLSTPLPQKQDRAAWTTFAAFDQPSSYAMARLLANLCEPNVKKSHTSELNSTTALTKRELAKYLYIILHCYVSCSLATGFPLPLQANLRTGMYPVLDIMGSDRLKIANDMMDASGKAFMRTVYADYLKHGKWREEN